jgi:large subunit ribosomal protein L25
MAGDRITLVVTPREELGSRSSRRLRREGLVPGILYGSGNPRAFAVGERELRHALTGEHGLHAILDVVLEGQKTAHHAVLKDYQLDPVRSTLLHVDFHEVRLDRPIQAQVAVELIGTAEGVTRGGLLQQVLREVTVEALPMEMPDRLELDVTALDLGDSLRVADLAAPGNATVLDDPETVIVSVVTTRRATAEEGLEAEEAAAEEGAAEPEAEAGAEPEGAGDES